MIFDRGSTNITTDLTAKVLRYQPHPERASSTFTHAEDDVLMLEASCFNVLCRSSSYGDAPYSDPYLRMVIDIFDNRGICIGTGYLNQIPESTNARCQAVVVS
jgi:hypothetical protein